MTAGLRVGIAQWTPDSDPRVNLRTVESALRELGRVGLCVCFDGDFPETARSLRDAGADLS
jgi:predicted amidohydrolase